MLTELLLTYFYAIFVCFICGIVTAAVILKTTSGQRGDGGQCMPILCRSPLWTAPNVTAE